MRASIPPTPLREASRPGWLASLALLAGGSLPFLLHALLVGDYLADDAAISLCYARSLAQGHGAVFQPGDPPVEGFSNPLWVAILALAHALGASLPAAAKWIGGALGLAAAWLAWRLAVGALDVAARVAWLVPVACGLSASYVIWSTAGLEGALLALLLVGLVRAGTSELATSQVRRGGDPRWRSLGLALLIAATRPEGIAYGVAFGATRGIAGLERRGATLRWLASLLGLFALGIGARWLYFGDVVPNTFYAKLPAGGGISGLVRDRLVPGASYLGQWLGSTSALVLLLLGLLGLVATRRRAPAPVLLALALFAAGAAFPVYAGGDFYRAGRFMGPWVPLLAVLAAWGIDRVAGRRPEPYRRRAGLLVGAVVILLLSTNAITLHRFLEYPSVPFARVVERGRHYAELARTAHLRDASLMDPDVGGTTYASGLRIVDMGGLTDVTLGRALRDGTYGPELFRDYVLLQRRPTFIHTFEPFTQVSGITTLPELERDYLELPVLRYTTHPAAALPTERSFVRRDVLALDPAAVPAGVTPIRVGPLELLAFGPARGPAARAVWRLWRRPGPDDSPVLELAGETHALLYGWLPPEEVPLSVAWVQYLELPPGVDRPGELWVRSGHEAKRVAPRPAARDARGGPGELSPAVPPRSVPPDRGW